MQNEQTNLQRIRLEKGMSRKQLANASEVGIRTIEKYEQRGRDINKAQLITAYNLANALGCDMKDLME